jgi:hypothetical protein
VEDIDDLAARGELAREYQKFIDHNGTYRMRSSSTEERGRRTPHQRLVELHAKRWPAEPKSARVTLLELLARRWEWENERDD